MTPAMTSAMAPGTAPASASTSGVGSWYIPHSLAQPLNIASEHFGSLQHPLASLFEGFLIQFSPSKPRQPLIPGPSALSSCSRISSPMQLACQGGEDIADYSPSPLGPTRWETWGPSQQIDAMVDVPDLCVRGPVSHQFYGGLSCP